MWPTINPNSTSEKRTFVFVHKWRHSFERGDIITAWSARSPCSNTIFYSSGHYLSLIMPLIEGRCSPHLPSRFRRARLAFHHHLLK